MPYHLAILHMAWVRGGSEERVVKGRGDIAMQYKDGNNYVTKTKFVKVEYTWKPYVCENCCVFGHGSSKCKKRIVQNQKQRNVSNVAVDKQDNEGFVKVTGKSYGMNIDGVIIGKQINKGNEIKNGKENEEEEDNVIKDKALDRRLDVEEFVKMRKKPSSDFNVTLKMSEHTSGGSVMSGDMIDFQDCVNSLKVEDIFNSHGQMVIIPEGMERKRRSFRFVNYIVDKEEFMDFVKKEWEVDVHGYKVVQKLKSLKKPLNNLNWKNGNCMEKVTVLKNKLREVQTKVEKNLFNIELKDEAVNILNDYLEATKDELKLLHYMDRIKWLNEVDQNTTFFHAEVFVKNFQQFIGVKQPVQPLNSIGITFDNVTSKDDAIAMPREDK
ncbi:hypothetical protein Tco_0983235 [Tanacetum coccineum]